jgi:acyl carrier protein
MIIDKLKDMISEQLGIEKNDVDENSDIIKDIGADSLDIVEMLMNVENEWGISIGDEEVAGLRTLADVAAFIEEKTK